MGSEQVVAIGNDDFASIVENNDFYVDKTEFIREWWNSRDKVTLITRPRRFGKTLNLSMLNCFFSNQYAGRSDLFERFNVWKDPCFQKLQGCFPVIYLTFAGVKAGSFDSSFHQIRSQVLRIFSDSGILEYANRLDPLQQEALRAVSDRMSMEQTAYALNLLSSLMESVYGRKVLIFLDEYDTPLQEAYLGGYWDEEVSFIRTLLNNTFKTNRSLERALMTGITRVSKESIFSDLNNLEIVTTTTEKYETGFGFTETEVFQKMTERGFTADEMQGVKSWYDGFTFGKVRDIYNPWSVTSFLDKREFQPYWANTSSNALIEALLQKGDPEIKRKFEDLLAGGEIETPLDEQIVFSDLEASEEAVWGLLLTSGYLRVNAVRQASPENLPIYTLALTNQEVSLMFMKMISRWFSRGQRMSCFVKAMLEGDARLMNRYMNDIALNTMSYFDSGNMPSLREPENFYHGLILGLVVDQTGDYQVKSNRESGYGRYDVVMQPKRQGLPAVIMEFKVFDREDDEKSLEDTASNALKQIEEKKYDTELLAEGIPQEKILKYGLAFRGKECLIRKA